MADKKFAQHDRVSVTGTEYSGRVCASEKHTVYGFLYMVEMDQDMGSISQSQLFFREADLTQLECKVGAGATITNAEGIRSTWTIRAVSGEVMFLNAYTDGKDDLATTIIAKAYGNGKRWRIGEGDLKGCWVQYGVRIENEPEEEEPKAEASEPAETVETATEPTPEATATVEPEASEPAATVEPTPEPAGTGKKNQNRK